MSLDIFVSNQSSASTSSKSNISSFKTVNLEAGTSCNTRGNTESYSSTSTESKSGTFLDQMPQEKNDKMQGLLAKAIYASDAPLSLVEHPLWKTLFKELRPAFSLPIRKTLSTTMLEKEFRNSKNSVDKIINNSKFLSIQCDGWSNLRNEGIINVIITTPQPVFTKFIGTAENRHTSEYISEQIIISKLSKHTVH